MATPSSAEATFATRRLVSDVGFLRLPGGLAWLGQRSVRTVNGEAVGGGVPRLEDLLMSAGPDVFASAKAIAEANAKFNLGYPRSMNVPTLPLELLGRSHHRAFRAGVEGRALGHLVPVRLSESYSGRSRGEGTASYSNYRKFQTAGRILPPGH